MSSGEIGRLVRQIPTQYPFVLVDRILEHDPAGRLLAVKNVTGAEDFFADDPELYEIYTAPEQLHQIKPALEARGYPIEQAKVEVGQDVVLAGGMEMKNFESKTLGRTFDSVIFSTGIVPPGGGAVTPAAPSASAAAGAAVGAAGRPARAEAAEAASAAGETRSGIRYTFWEPPSMVHAAIPLPSRIHLPAYIPVRASVIPPLVCRQWFSESGAHP